MDDPMDLGESDERQRETKMRILVVDACCVRGLIAALAGMESKSLELDPAVAFVSTEAPERIEAGNRGYAERTKPFVPEMKISAYRSPRMRRNGLRSQVSPYGRTARKSGQALRQSARKFKR